MTIFQMIIVFCMAFCCLSFVVLWIFLFALIASNHTRLKEVEEITKILEGKK